MIRLTAGSASDPGRVRRGNQDHALLSDLVFAVADGMGGHQGGEVASEVAVTELGASEAFATLDDLVAAVHRSNDRVVDRSREDPELRGMGTTLCVLAALGPDRLGVANVGDSRIYLGEAGGLLQLTEDHSLVEALVRDGRLTRDEAAVHPQRNIVTRALGIDDKVLVDAWELAPVPGDRYVICSDGLFNEVAAIDIAATLNRIDDPEAAAAALVEAANKAGGRDNVTVVVVDVLDAPEFDDPPRDRVVATRRAVPEGARPMAATDGAAASLDPDDGGGIVDEMVDAETDGAAAETPASVPFITWRLGIFVVAVLFVMGVLLTSVVLYARSTYYVGIDGDEVVVYRGRPGGVLWFDPTVEEEVSLRVAEVDESDLDDLLDGREFDSLDEARQYGVELQLRAEPADPSNP